MTIRGLILVGLLALPVSGAPDVAGVEIRKAYQQGGDVVLSFKVPSPVLETVADPQGAPHVKVSVPGAGRFAEPGQPSLPVLHAFFETPRQTPLPKVLLQQVRWRQVSLPHPVWPAQPPLEKRPGRGRLNSPFVKQFAAYAGRGFKNPAAQQDGAWFKLTPVVKGKMLYFKLALNVFSFHPETNRLKYPEALTVRISWRTGAGGKKSHFRHRSPGSMRFFRVPLKNREEGQLLARRGFDIASIKGETALVYGDDQDREALAEAGFKALPHDLPPAADDGGGGEVEPGRREKGAPYYTVEELATLLEDLQTSYPGLCRVERIGQSVLGRDIWAVKISDNVATDEPEPEVRLVAAMHGNEPPGMVLMLRFIDHLLTGYGEDPRVTAMVDRVELWIVPLLNPDGYHSNTRSNAMGVDLNRAFPDRINDPVNTTEGRPPEVAAMMDFCDSRNFVLAANFHTGAVVVNYPFDSNETGLFVDTPTGDDGLFREISLAYARENPDMWNSQDFDNGITNGAAWYVIHGGLQDWSYVWHGTHEVTVEIWNDFKPEAPAVLDTIWANNRDAVMAYVETVYTGVTGTVRDETTGDPVAHVQVSLADNMEHTVRPEAATGIYHRMLIPGTYSLVFWAPGYWPAIVPDVEVTPNALTMLDVTLTPKDMPRQEAILLVAHDSLLPGAQVMRTFYEEAGFEASVYAFSAALQPAALRDAIRAEYARSPFEYLLLVGDTDTLPAFDRGTHISDLLYSLLDPGEDWDDYLGRDVVLGRLPFTGNNDIMTYRLKLDRFLRKNRDQRFAWLSFGDDAWECGVSENTHEWVVDNILTGEDLFHTFYFCDQGAMNDFLVDAGGGLDVVTYSGHGRWNRWVKWNFTASEFDAVEMADNPPVILSYACDTGRFERSVCFGEACVQGEGRGIFFLGGSDSTYWEEDDVLEKTMFQVMADAEYAMPLGQALYDGIEEVDRQSAEGGYYSEIYHIFGNPALSLSTGFSVADVAWADDGNQVAEPGETGVLSFTLANLKGFDLHDARAFLDTGTPHLFVRDMTLSLGDFVKGSEKRLEFNVTVQGTCPVPLTAMLNLVIESEETRSQKAFPFTVHKVSLVTGTVSFLGDGQPVQEAQVRILDSDRAPVTTDDAGGFAVSLMEGEYTLRVEYPGYLSEEQTVSLPPDREHVDFLLGWSEGLLTPAALEVLCSPNEACEQVVSLYNQGNKPMQFQAAFDVDRNTASGGYSAVEPHELGEAGDQWIDIPDGNVLHDGYEDDAVWGPFSLPVAVPFFGQPQQEVYVSSNGFIAFAATTDSFYNSEKLPSMDVPSMMVAAFWTDLVVKSDGRVTMGTADGRVVITFSNVSLFNDNTGFSFQVVMHDSGKIVLNYQDAPLDRSDVIAGLQDATGTRGLTARLNDLSGSTVVLTDQPGWIRMTPSSGTVPGGISVPLTFQIYPEAAMGSRTISCFINTNSPRQDMLTLPVTVNFEGQSGGYFLRGDANQDTVLDLGDVVATLSYLFSDGRAGCLAALDANSDANLDLSDAVYLLMYLFQDGGPPPPPFPMCGFFEGPLRLPCANPGCGP